MDAEKKVSIVIASYNMAQFLPDTITNCLNQKYPNKEIIVYNDCSTDETSSLDWERWKSLGIKYYCGETNLGVGDAFNRAITFATGDYVMLMCADDLIATEYYLDDIVEAFEEFPKVGHVSRWYYQFVDGYEGPVRAWRSMDPLVQANNPSGLVFRKKALNITRCSNRMFIETSSLVRQVIVQGWDCHILRYDAIAARVHQSTSTQKDYWLKRRVSSPIEDWVDLGAYQMLKDYASLIQIKNGFTMKALLEEIDLFIKLRPINALNPMFWFFALVAIITPRPILRKLPEFYRHRIGRYITREVKRV